jgi:hypothetical protein
MATKRKIPGVALRPNRLPEPYTKTTVDLLDRHVRWIGNRKRSALIRALIDAEMEREGHTETTLIRGV